jgi:hypothetical protein
MYSKCRLPRAHYPLFFNTVDPLRMDKVALFWWRATTSLVALAVMLGVIRWRAGPLIQAGRVARSEVTRFLWAVLAIVGGGSLAFASIEFFAGAENLACLTRFPPQHIAGVASWSIQAGLSGALLWWLWTRNGADVLARLAPIFTRGPVLDRSYDPSDVRLLASAVAVLPPLIIMILQWARAHGPACRLI